MNYILAFIFCGFVCVVAQLIYEYTKLTPGHITSMFVVIGAFLDLFHIYDKLVEIFHAGALLPITSFGHSLTHAAVEAAVQSDYLGLFTGIFDLTSSGIAAAIFFSFVIALVCRPRG